MKDRVKKGSKINAFTVQEMLREDSVFTWVRATRNDNGREVHLQIVTKSSGITREMTEAIRKSLHEIQKELSNLSTIRGLCVPEAILAEPEYPLVAVYPHGAYEALENKLRSDPSLARTHWEAASETLHAMHEQKLVHGHVAPDSFVVVGEKVYLRDFGYAPLLEKRHENTLSELREFVAPEVSSAGKLTTASDIYSFAKTLTSWEPNLKDADWYDKATQLDPENRYTRIRDMFPHVEETLLGPVPAQDPGPTPLKRKVGNLPTRKYQLRIDLEPPGGGDVAGAKAYLPGERPEIRAMPKSGWRFVRWSGNFEGTSSQAAVLMDGDKTITAHFVKIRPVGLKINSKPSRAGKVVGGRAFEEGQTAQIRAVPEPGWRFAQWSGAATGSENPVEVVMDGNRAVCAHFARESSGTETFPNRVVVALGSPWVVLPFCSGLTVLDVLWMLHVESKVGIVAGIVCALWSFGVFARRLRTQAE